MRALASGAVPSASANSRLRELRPPPNTSESGADRNNQVYCHATVIAFCTRIRRASRYESDRTLGNPCLDGTKIGRPVSRALRPLPWQRLRLRQYWQQDPHKRLMSICTR